MEQQAPKIATPLAAVIATLAGTGRASFAPGTVASVVALPFAWLLLHFTGVPGLILAILAATAIGTWACDVYARETGLQDPSECVVDELAGQWLACAFAPLSIPALALAFVLFRVFDIVKPWPVSAAERLSGGAGIMADDLVAGAMAGMIVAVASALGLI
jgi:phosphatidylglycerophosphatase A